MRKNKEKPTTKPTSKTITPPNIEQMEQQAKAEAQKTLDGLYRNIKYTSVVAFLIVLIALASPYIDPVYEYMTTIWQGCHYEAD